MKCEEMPEKLVSLLYGELDKEETEAVRKHIKTCTGCREAFEEMKGTSRILDQWEDEAPKAHFVFVHQPASGFETWKERFKSLGRSGKIAFGIPAAALFLFLFLGLSRFQIHYTNGDLRMGFGIQSGMSTEEQNRYMVDAIRQVQTETVTLVSDILQQSEERLRRENTLILTQFARDIESQRQTDLRMMGQGLQGLQLVSENRYLQTRDVLDNLVRMASYNVGREN